MAQLIALTDLYVNLEHEVPGASEQMMLQALQIASRELTRRTDGFYEDLHKIAGVEWQQDYSLSCPFSLTAQIRRILEVKVNSSLYMFPWYDLHLGNQLRFKSNSIPHDMDEKLLTCGTAGENDYTVWAAITDASFGFEIDETYAVADLDFTGVTSMYEVAAKIQTAIRDAMESNTGFCEWSVNHFNLWTESGEISYLTEGASGTDISGVSYCNGLTGSATLSGLIEVRCSFTTDFNTDALPDWFLDMHSDTLIGGATAHLAAMNKKPFTSATAARLGKLRFNQGLAMARRENDAEYKDGIIGISG